MEAVTPWLVPLPDAHGCAASVVGGKAATLARLAQAGCRVPAGFCLTVAAYELFLRDCRIEDAIRMELGRKSRSSLSDNVRLLLSIKALSSQIRATLIAEIGCLEFPLAPDAPVDPSPFMS